MTGHDVLRNISIIGGICSIIVTTVSYLLLWLELKDDKYLNKLVNETPIEKYARVIAAGQISVVVFGVTILLLKLF